MRRVLDNAQQLAKLLSSSVPKSVPVQRAIGEFRNASSTNIHRTLLMIDKQELRFQEDQTRQLSRICCIDMQSPYDKIQIVARLSE